MRTLAMKKWFNTNYHYIVPEFEDDMTIALSGEKPFEEYRVAKALGIETKPVILGPYTLLQLLRFTGNKTADDILPQLADAYGDLLRAFGAEGAAWVQFDEPSLVMDMSLQDVERYSIVKRSKPALRSRRRSDWILVHGEFERNDMVEYFGENLCGFLFTQKA